MATKNPTPKQILAALKNAGVDVKTYKGWDTVGRPWRGPDGSPGLTGAVIHHTATASATGSQGAPSLYWAVTAYDRPVCNLLIGRGPGDTYLLSAGSAYHCGDGGPVPALGIPQRGYYGQTRLFGIEIDDPGVSKTSLTAYQIEQTAKTLAALANLCGWDVDKAVGTHGCYTNGCHGWNPQGPSPTLGRKNDTLEEWGAYPGNPQPVPYNAPWWRDKIKNRLTPPLWDGTVPRRAAILKSITENTPNRAVYRLACRLYDLGYGDKPAKKGDQLYPADAVAAFRAAQGWGTSGSGYSTQTEKRIWGKTKA